MPSTEDQKKPNENPGQKDQKDAAPPKAEGDNLDEFGYEKPAPKTPEKTEDKGTKDSPTGYGDDKEPTKEPVKEDKEIDPATGYDKEPAKEPVKEEKKDDPPAEDDLEIKDPGDLLPEEIAQIKEFAKKHKVSKEVALAMVEDKKAEIKKYKEAATAHAEKVKAQVAEQKRKWFKELKDDPDFGGEKFNSSVKQVEKVIDDHFSNLKKKLTETKEMLPPYVMKDLAKLAAVLYSTPKLVEGEPVAPKKDDKEENDPLAFYNS